MAKRSGGGASRAQRKQARARKRHSNARGLSREETRSEAATDAPIEAEAQTEREARSKLPLLGKVGIFLLLLFGAIWVAAQFRQGEAQ